MQFRKMHGLGNDFVILDFREESEPLSPGQIKHICDRNFGVGCDLLTVIEPSDNAEAFAKFYNADGSQSAACGNASRCVADIIMKEQQSETCVIETARGLLPCARAENEMVTVDMGAPLNVQKLDLSQDGLNEPISVNMGNPHCVFFVDNLEDINVEKIGASVENNPIFPDKTNVEFVEILSDTKMRQKTWERGVGITLACGSGACAVAVAGAHTCQTKAKVEIELDGGALFIEQRQNDNHLLMTGPVAYVFEGSLFA
ncbi:MAG: diaminopimelate epimerase [Bdellovibrionales bacterium]